MTRKQAIEQVLSNYLYVTNEMREVAEKAYNVGQLAGLRKARRLMEGGNDGLATVITMEMRLVEKLWVK